jgi:hypothetical protein
MNQENLLLTAFEELKNALMVCDQRRLDELISDTYQGFSLHGTIENKQDILQAYKPGAVELTTYSTSDLQVEVTGEIGIITGKGRIEGSYEEFRFKHHVLFTDIFRLDTGQWKYYRSQVTEIASP